MMLVMCGVTISVYDFFEKNYCWGDSPVCLFCGACENQHVQHEA